jgi:hypothetical protein
VRSLLALARREDGARTPLPELVRECLGIEVGPIPESVFTAAHDQLDRSLPAGAGSLAHRLHAWRRQHELPVDQLSRLPAMVEQAVAETRARTEASIVPLPDEQVDCQLVPDAPFLAAGWHRGGTRSTILISADRPFNLADLLYVVAHEGHPGHIAEQVLKEIDLVQRQGRAEQQVRFLPSPPYVLSEGLGLQARSLIFPGGQGHRPLAGRGAGARRSRPPAAHRATPAVRPVLKARSREPAAGQFAGSVGDAGDAGRAVVRGVRGPEAEEGGQLLGDDGAAQ